ncbi:MAG: hypothetical protein ACKOCJ_08645 [Burkholderiaceae bacterium]
MQKHPAARPRATLQSTFALAAGLLIAAAPVQAQTAGAGKATVYRCGNTYSQTPCADVSTPASPVEVADPRSPEQVRAAREVAERDASAAKALQTEREKREREQREAQAARERATARAQAQAADQARAAERAAIAEQQRREREMIVIPRKPATPASGNKPFTAVAPEPARPASAPQGKR